jgi:hypothetical protein
VIFFSSTSSSANFFWYFSQLEPVADGMMMTRGECVAVVGVLMCPGSDAGGAESNGYVRR